MKKKLLALASIVLIVVLTCSLFACNKTMFDGRYTKEATDEQAAAAWNGARESMKGGSSTVNMATSEAGIKGWTGAQVEFNGSMSTENTEKDKVTKTDASYKINGSILFDMSAVALSAQLQYPGDGDAKHSLNAGLYVKDKTYYSDLTFDDQALQFKHKISEDLTQIATNEFVQATIEGLSLQFTSLSSLVIQSALNCVDYDTLKTLGVKAYIDDSGDYNRVKFEFTKEFLARMQGETSEEEIQKFVEGTTMGDCYLIVVSNKSDKVFQGAKVGFDFRSEIATNDESLKTTMKADASISNISEIKSYPGGIDNYKDAKDLTLGEIKDFFANLDLF